MKFPHDPFEHVESLRRYQLWLDVKSELLFRMIE